MELAAQSVTQHPPLVVGGDRVRSAGGVGQRELFDPPAGRNLRPICPAPISVNHTASRPAWMPTGAAPVVGSG